MSFLPIQLLNHLGKSNNGRRAEPPFPGQGQVGATESLVDVHALVGNGLVLNNGTFIRMLEVAPVDLERVDASIKKRYWAMFANALRRLRAPLGIQIVISTRPQDLTPYLARWECQAREWQALAESGSDLDTHQRRTRMARSALETAAF
jgi:hypothetical protein